MRFFRDIYIYIYVYINLCACIYIYIYIYSYYSVEFHEVKNVFLPVGYFLFLPCFLLMASLE